MITLINRSRIKALENVMTGESLDILKESVALGETSLVYLNRRGAFRSYVCRDCSHIWMCPRCDISLTLHVQKHSELVCHHCGYRENLPDACPKCRSQSIAGVGTAIQEVERFLASHFDPAMIARIDSDSEHTVTETTRILVSTQYVLRDIPKLDSLVILTPEAELVVPEYDIEERVYLHIRLLSRSARQTIIETNIPDSPFIRLLAEGNYKDFLAHTLEERKRFDYPPYADLAYIRIRDKNPDRLVDLAARIKSKLDAVQKDEGESGVRYDQSVRVRFSGEYMDTIVVRSKNLSPLLSAISPEVLRNRGVRVEIR